LEGAGVRMSVLERFEGSSREGGPDADFMRSGGAREEEGRSIVREERLALTDWGPTKSVGAGRRGLDRSVLLSFVAIVVDLCYGML
jgi:hypothetical protein